MANVIEMHSRRTFLTSILGSSAAVVLAEAAAQPFTPKAGLTTAQMRQAGAHAQVAITPLRRNLSMLSGSGGNIVVLPGSGGKLLVDSGFATSQNQLATALHAVSPDPLKLLVNTHWHFDHTDGNQWVHTAGAAILAHSKTLSRMKQREVIPEFEGVYPPSPAGSLPTMTFERQQVLEFNGDKLVLTRYTPAHTDTDTSVYFGGADVLHTGDTWFNGFYPFIDYNSGGSIDGMIAASGENLSFAGRSTIVIPGHGAAGHRNDVAAFHQMLVEVRSAVARLKKTGASAQEVVARKPTSSYDEQWGGGFISPRLFTWLVYRGV